MLTGCHVKYALYNAPEDQKLENLNENTVLSQCFCNYIVRKEDSRRINSLSQKCVASLGALWNYSQESLSEKNRPRMEFER